jgi:tRNA dimethylallyltransferase
MSNNVPPWHDLLSSHLVASKAPLVVIVGPTASGKTDFSLRLARFIAETSSEHGWEGAEIINADSRQLYCQLNVGTAKITQEEAGTIPHHLIDILDPKEEVTVAHYQEKAYRVIDEILSRKRVPVLVGGSMLYVSAVMDGLQPLPSAPPELRKKIEEEYDKDDGWSLFDRLQQVDPKTAAAFDKMNKVYVVRAMELYEMTGLPPSSLKKTVPPPYQILALGVHRPRPELMERIEERTRTMLANGWVEEVEGLIDRGYTPQDPAMKSHGYKEIMAWLRGEERDRSELERVIAAKTKQYAKRQMTWWADDERIRWVDVGNDEGFVQPRSDGGTSVD